ncbi:MAG TPA: hypothetical protein VIG04_13540 [Gemmatimonadales bacterium]|jgi:hypothetical protein
MLRAALALTALLYLTGCEEWHLSINSDGLVFVSVIGEGSDPLHRFRLRIREADSAVRTLDMPASGQLTVKAAADGPLELTLLTPEGCRVRGSNPRTLTMTAGQEVGSVFDVRCA